MAKVQDNDIDISVRDVHKEFILPQSKNSTFKQTIVNIVKKNNKVTQKVLDGISFDVKKGDFFGIVGRNGSGKSTLLKIMAGVYSPTKGEVKINGQLTPFIELGVGFNPELSGHDNIYLNGALLGFTRKQIDTMYKDIVEFAELEPFMGQKLKNYSSGMQVRLAFSIAIKAKGDILIFDEVLAVGDEAFQRKCNDYFDLIKKDKSKTVILVTHSMDAVKRYCNRALLIEDGTIKHMGSPSDVANQYSLDNNIPTTTTIVEEDVEEGVEEKVNKDSEKILDVSLELISPKIISEKDEVEISVSYKTLIDNTKIAIDLFDIDKNIPVFSGVSKVFTEKGYIKQIYKIGLHSINDANLKVAFAIRNKNSELLAYLPEDKLPTFILRRSDYSNSNRRTSYAVIYDKGTWSKD